MTIQTNVGEIQIEENDIVFFSQGLPGFETLSKFAIIALEDTKPIQWLVSLEDQEVSLPVIDPWIVRFDYHLDIPKNIIDYLAITNQEKVFILSIVRIPGNQPKAMTVNLAAPIIINLENNQALQYIPEKSDYTLRHLVKEELERTKKMTQEKNGDG
ncbi:MAG TPA: flagellar assembly protein FliW [Thermotogota bacterium]|nr:flagellar assembly protein FliW [Thermotogota bacterium]HRW33902.1 flagellar assembly protein FliW [Thermotogota bacterium]